MCPPPHTNFPCCPPLLSSNPLPYPLAPSYPLPSLPSSDILNKANQHRELAENLKKDVLDELTTLRERVVNAGKVSVSAVGVIVARLKAAEKAYRSSHRSYDRAWQEAKMHCCSSNLTMDETLKNSMQQMLVDAAQKAEINRIQAMDDPEFEAKMTQKATVKAFGLSSPIKDLSNWLLPTTESRRQTTIEVAVDNLLLAEQARKKCADDWKVLVDTNLKCAIEVQQTLNSLQAVEESVVVEIQDMLRKHIVLESSCFANLQYDIQMLFGVMESVNVEKDLCSYIVSVQDEHKTHKITKQSQDQQKILSEKTELEEVVGNDITLHSEVIMNALEEEYEVDRRYVSLFESVSRDLPYPPFAHMIETPMDQSAGLQENIPDYTSFWNWEKITLERMGDVRVVADKNRSMSGIGSFDAEGGSSGQLLFADTIDEVLKTVLTQMDEADVKAEEAKEDYLKKIRSEIQASVITEAAVTVDVGVKEEKLPEPPKPEPEELSETPQFITGVSDEFEEDSLFPSKPSTQDRGNGEIKTVPLVPPRRQFPSITALQSPGQTMILSKLMLHMLPDYNSLSATEGGVSAKAVSGIVQSKPPRNAVEARAFLNKISATFTSTNLPLMLEASDLIEATTAFSAVIFEASKKPTEESSQLLLRDCVLISCFLTTTTEGVVKLLLEDSDVGDGNGALLKYIQGLMDDKRIGYDGSVFFRQVLGMHPFWKSGKVPVQDVLQSVVTAAMAQQELAEEGGKGIIPDHLAEGGFDNSVVGQVAFMSWNFHQYGVPSGSIKKAVRETLVSTKSVFAGVDTLISTCLDLSSRVRGRSASAGFGSNGGGNAFASNGSAPAKQQWEVIGAKKEAEKTVMKEGSVNGDGAAAAGTMKEGSVLDASAINAEFETEGGMEMLDEVGRRGSVVDGFKADLEKMRLSGGEANF
jgi:hypothetical protein